VSRLLWNELYVDPTRAPEYPRCPAAQDLVRSAAWQAEHAALRDAPLVDYRRLAAHKRAVLAALARGLFAEPSSRTRDLERFLSLHPQVEDYARFRAAVERRGSTWPSWPEPLRAGCLRDGDYDVDASHYHAYVQWLAHEQLGALADSARAASASLYLDLPLGVHADGYDTWRERDAFASGAAGGAPPDSFFTSGQNWGFPPLHPRKLREQGYRYVLACLRHHLRYAAILRLDHVMGLHRLYWVPAGLEATDGVYVRYPAEELYALLTLESQRHRAVIVGEDLGTVPRAVRAAMSRHGIHRMYVTQFEVAPDPDRPLAPVPRTAVASLNTHDMPTFAAFWQAHDVQDRQALGLLDAADAARERAQRGALRQALARYLAAGGWLGDSTDLPAALRACLRYLAASPARVVLLNLEDLWLEPEPQNVPGTWQERPNWRRKARYSLEEFAALPEVHDTLREIDRLRTPGREES
jgi:4-alpha-glucanotransferase